MDKFTLMNGWIKTSIHQSCSIPLLSSIFLFIVFIQPSKWTEELINEWVEQGILSNYPFINPSTLMEKWMEELIDEWNDGYMDEM